LRPGDYDESDVRIRAGKGSRPRTKTRPEHADAQEAMVVTVDRGRWGCALGRDPDRRVTAMRARELGRTPIVVGDDVGIVGDLSGRPDTLARIVRRGERATVLRRTADDTDPTERVFVANADQLLIVVALADPPPRTGLVERALIPDRISPEHNRAFQSAPSLNEIFERLMTLQVDVALPWGGSGAVHAEAGFK